MPPIEPIKDAVPIVNERFESSKAEAPRTGKESQVGQEGRTFSCRDYRDQGGIAEAPDTLRYEGGPKLEDICAASEDGPTLDREAKYRRAAKEATKAMEGPPEGAGRMPRKGSPAQSQ